jgi:L-ascorbate metabolism protein UlaG (beta-lactamase superfamily)
MAGPTDPTAGAPLAITYVGHATTLIDLDGVSLLTDPILRNRVLHLQRRNSVAPDDLGDVDAVLISHLHWDHLDMPSLSLLEHTVRLMVPAGSGDLFFREGFINIVELDVGDVAHVNGVTVEAVHAEHDGSRLFSGATAPSLGFLVRGTRSVYFAGDTDLFSEMNALAGRIDVALLPVWGWGPTLGTGHMNPYRAALALRMLKPRHAVPIHWGTLHPIGLQLLRPAFLNEPPRTFARFARQLAPEVQVEIIEPGEWTAIDTTPDDKRGLGG